MTVVNHKYLLLTQENIRCTLFSTVKQHEPTAIGQCNSLGARNRLCQTQFLHSPSVGRPSATRRHECRFNSREVTALNRADLNLEACPWQYDGEALVIESASTMTRCLLCRFYHVLIDSNSTVESARARHLHHSYPSIKHAKEVTPILKLSLVCTLRATA